MLVQLGVSWRACVEMHRHAHVMVFKAGFSPCLGGVIELLVRFNEASLGFVGIHREGIVRVGKE
jgi:hypothetical protein